MQCLYQDFANRQFSRSVTQACMESQLCSNCHAPVNQMLGSPRCQEGRETSAVGPGPLKRVPASWICGEVAGYQLENTNLLVCSYDFLLLYSVSCDSAFGLGLPWTSVTSFIHKRPVRISSQTSLKSSTNRLSSFSRNIEFPCLTSWQSPCDIFYVAMLPVLQGEGGGNIPAPSAPRRIYCCRAVIERELSSLVPAQIEHKLPSQNFGMGLVSILILVRWKLYPTHRDILVLTKHNQILYQHLLFITTETSHIVYVITTWQWKQGIYVTTFPLLRYNLLMQLTLTLSLTWEEKNAIIILKMFWQFSFLKFFH